MLSHEPKQNQGSLNGNISKAYLTAVWSVVQFIFKGTFID